MRRIIASIAPVAMGCSPVISPTESFAARGLCMCSTCYVRPFCMQNSTGELFFPADDSRADLELIRQWCEGLDAAGDATIAQRVFPVHNREFLDRGDFVSRNFSHASPLFAPIETHEVVEAADDAAPGLPSSARGRGAHGACTVGVEGRSTPWSLILVAVSFILRRRRR